MKTNAAASFTEGPILPALVRFCVPILGALFLQAMYGAVDLMVVGKFGDATGVSAVGTGSAVMQLVTIALSGLTMGTTVAVGRHLGEKRPDEAGRVIGAGTVLFLAVALCLTLGMELFAEPLARLMRAPADAFPKTVQYVRICSAGIVFITAYNVLGGVFRGLGNSRLPMLFVAIACVVNIIGDLLLVGVLRMDAAGAAIATIAAQGVSVVLSLAVIRRTPLPFSLCRADFVWQSARIRRILRVGGPIAFQDALVHFSFLLQNAVINGMGLMESAGYGVAERVTAFIFLVPSAVMSGVSAFVAQNIGAGDRPRARRAMCVAMAAGSAAGVVLFAAGFFFGGALASVFTPDGAVIAQAASYLRGFSADCLLTCVLFAFTGYYNGEGNTLPVMLQGVTSSLLVRVPLSWWLAGTEGVTLARIGLAAPAATVYGIAFYLLWRRASLRRPRLG